MHTALPCLLRNRDKRSAGPARCGSLTSCAPCSQPAAFAAAWQAVAALDVAGVTADSRQVVPGDLFAALPGSRADGRAFIADAVERGAVAVLAPDDTDWPPGVPPRPLIRDPEPRRRLAQIAAVLAGPQPDTVVAVTGTNGKTSTVEFLRQIWAAGGLPGRQPGHAGRDRARLSARPRPDHARPGQPGRDPRRPRAAPASATRRWRRPRTAWTSRGSMACG